MLTGMAILEAVENGDIEITPFNRDNLNPNSYNLTLDNTLMVYVNPYIEERHLFCLDSRKENETVSFTIPKTGIILEPNILYLGSTVETTYTKNYVPCISGRSSVARLGICVHQTAGFGDIGFKGKWTLEFSVVERVKIYPGMKICQIYFEEAQGERSILYKGKYQNQSTVQSSKLYQDK